MPPQDPEAARWFAENLQPHEPMLRAWLRSRFTLEIDLDDIVQESYFNVLQGRTRGEIRSPKAFLFATARNVVLGRLRHLKVERIDSLAETDFSGILDEGEGVPEVVARAEELEMLTKAIQSLPRRCRQIVTLRRIYGLPQKEIAAQLGISEHTVEAQGTIAVRKIAEYFEAMGGKDPRKP